MVCVSYKNPRIKKLHDIYYDSNDVDLVQKISKPDINIGTKVYFKYGISKIKYGPEVFLNILKRKAKTF